MSLDGMLTSDGKEMPRSVWWAYKACERPACLLLLLVVVSLAALLSDGAVNGTLLVMNATQSVDGVAALSEDGKRLSAAVGMKGGGSAGGACGPAGAARDNRTMLRFEGIPTSIGGAGASTVEAAVAHIPGSGAAPLLAPSVTAQTVHVLAGGVLELALDLASGDGAFVVVGSNAEKLVKDFATPPAVAGEGTLN